jgi:hypothetical protein
MLARNEEQIREAGAGGAHRNPERSGLERRSGRLVVHKVVDAAEAVSNYGAHG